MSEISIAYFQEEFGMSRRKATWLNIGIAMVLGIICALSFGMLSDFTICGLTVFNLFDYLSSNILLPVGGLIISIFVGWVLDRAVVQRELVTVNPGRATIICVRLIVFCLRYLAPLCIAAVFIFGLGLF